MQFLSVSPIIMLFQRFSLNRQVKFRVHAVFCVLLSLAMVQDIPTMYVFSLLADSHIVQIILEKMTTLPSIVLSTYCIRKQ